MTEKENCLTFQNITHTMKLCRTKRNGFCMNHPDRTAKYRSRDQDIFYCGSCAIQEASRGVVIEDMTKSQQQTHLMHSTLTLIQEVYQQSQDQIQQYIRVYNCKYQKLLEAMTDMQIRDLINFNRKIEENHNIYKRLKDELGQNWDRGPLLKLFANPDSQPILNHIDQLINDIARLSTRNQHKSPKVRSKMSSPQPPSKPSSPVPMPKNGSQSIEQQDIRLNVSKNSLQDQYVTFKENTRQSFTKSQPNTNSIHSKNSTIEEIKKSVLEDTPESVKMMVSQSGVRVTADMAVTMFEKIDICESINLCQSRAEKESTGKESGCSLKRRNRYGDQV